MSAITSGRKRIVEAHRDVADEKSARIGDFESGRCAANQSIRFVRRESREFLGEVLLEVDAKLLRHGGEIKRELMVKVAHRFSTPILGYTTGGEYLMLNESLPKEPRARLDALNQYFTNLADTGMTAMISYFAQEYAQLRSQFAIK